MGRSEVDPEHEEENEKEEEVRTGERRILIAKESVFSGVDPSIVRISHPRTKELQSYLIDKENTTLKEILTYTEENRSWFIGSTIESNGHVYLATSMDPLLILLPYLRASDKKVPLDQLISNSSSSSSEDVEHIQRIVQSDKLAGPKKMAKIADSKGSADLNVWVFNESKTLAYLGKKVERVCEALVQGKVNIEGGATSGQFVKTLNKDVDRVSYMCYSHGLLASYLEVDLASKLRAHLKLPKEEDLEKENKSKKRDSKTSFGADIEEEETAPKKKAKGGSQEPLEDYSKGYKKAVVKESPANSKQKALAKSAAGSKNIMSFFAKK